MAHNSAQLIATQQRQRGPTIVLNWLAKLQGKPLLATHEFPLYTDTRITGQVAHGPYYFLNAVPLAQGIVAPAIILRYEEFWESPEPNFSKTDAEQYHGGTPADELAALASLALGVRFKAGDTTRYFEPQGDPKGIPRAWTRRTVPILLDGGPLHRWVIPQVAEGEHSLELLEPVGILPKLNPSAAISLIRSARLYQDALWLAESEPALAWLLLVSALETAAVCWRSQTEDPLDRFKGSKPELYADLHQRDPELAKRVAEEFKDSFGVTRKFVDFVLTFRPTEPERRPESWGRIDWSDTSLDRILKIVYAYRSKALHSGKPFPAPMCDPPFRLSESAAPAEKPLGHVSVGMSVWREEDIPISLHTFEYVARGTLLNWWRAEAPAAKKDPSVKP